MQPYSASSPMVVRGQHGRDSVQKGKSANVLMDKCICSFYSNSDCVDIHVIDWLGKRSEFFPVQTDPKLVNNVFIFFPAVNWLKSGFL